MMMMLLRQGHSRTMGASFAVSSGLHIRHLTCHRRSGRHRSAGQQSDKAGARLLQGPFNSQGECLAHLHSTLLISLCNSDMQGKAEAALHYGQVKHKKVLATWLASTG